MSDPIPVTSRIMRLFQWMAIIALNVVVLFVILNVSIWGYYKLADFKSKSQESSKTPMRFKQSNEALQKLFPNFSKEEIDQLISDSRRISQEYDSFTQFKEGPYKTRFVNVDVNGFRLSKNQGQWPPRKNDFVIFLFGGSTSFGYGVPDNETVASHLQEILTAKINLPVKIYNFGRAAYFSSQERILFEKLLLEGKVPDMAIFMDGVNEFILYDGDPGYTERFKKFMREGDVPIMKSLLNELPLMKLISNRVLRQQDKIHDSSKILYEKPPNDESHLLTQVIHRYQTNKKIIEAISRDFGISTVFIWQPMPLFGYDQTYHIFKNFDYATFSPHLKRGYEFVSAVQDFREIGNNFIWLADAQRDIKEPVYVSAFHYSPKMSKAVAGMISEALLDRNLIPSHSNIAARIVSMRGAEGPIVSTSSSTSAGTSLARPQQQTRERAVSPDELDQLNIKRQERTTVAGQE